MKQKNTVIGITGGVASGKSTVAKMLLSLGAQVIDADKICHQLMNNEEIKIAIAKRWANSVLDKQGKIDRRILAKIVFRDKRELLALNKIIHPKAIKQIKNQIRELTIRGKTNVVVIDAALLVETNLTQLCDKILFISTDRKICEKRAKKNRDWPLCEVEKRERFQVSLKDKKNNADSIIDNGRSKTNTFKQVKGFWKQFITKI
ncbi:MAG: dephospho-CoA kinase [Candidatus Scalindua sp.]|nr:dephospho-CoA kinase [Candidatus Scalindua sp.]